MEKFEDTWRDQCDAAVTIQSRYGEQAALDYLIGEKLLLFTTTARKHPDFARQLPSFVARLRKMFRRDVLLRYLTDLEARLTEDSHEINPEDIGLEPPAKRDLESLKQVADFLRAEALGIA